MTFWHGGGRIGGDRLLPGDQVDATRAAGDWVYVTTDRSLAEMYATSAEGPAWVYEVEPVGDVVESPSLVGGPVISFTCAEARIVRRFTLSNRRRQELLECLFWGEAQMTEAELKIRHFPGGAEISLESPSEPVSRRRRPIRPEPGTGQPDSS